MGRFFILFLQIFIPLAFPLLSMLNIDVQAESAILINGTSGAVLFEKDSQRKLYPASTTKIATAIFALLAAPEKLGEMATADHDTVASITAEEKQRSHYTLPSYWLEPGASNIALKKGEQLSIRDLLYGMMIISGDDASNLIAKHIGGTVAHFMTGLNTYLQSIGCKNTHFTNPHGLFHPEHYTTASDMALLTQEALKNPLFRELVKTSYYTRPQTNKQPSMTWKQSNRLLLKGPYFYPHAIGVKTGYIQAAQNTFVGAAEKDQRLLIAVLLKSKDRGAMFADAVKLFEAAFTEPLVERVLLLQGPQPYTFVSKRASGPIATYLEKDLAVKYYPSEEPVLSCQLFWDDVKFPLQKGERVGELKVYDQHQQVIQQADLKASEKMNLHWRYRLMSLLENWSIMQIAAALMLIVCLTIGIVLARR